MSIITWIKNIFTKKPDLTADEFLAAANANADLYKAVTTYLQTMQSADPFVRNELGGTIRRIIVTEPLRPTDLMRSDDPLSPLIRWTSTSTDRTEYEVEGVWYSEEEYQRLLKLKAWL